MFYSNDARDIQAEHGNWWESYDERAMTVSVAVSDGEDDGCDEPRTVAFPMKFKVCSLCRGKGSHVNPSIDAHGLSREDFMEDPDFEEDYRSGVYDQQCYRCSGKRVEPEIVEENLSEELQLELKRFHNDQKEEAEYRALVAMERRMGC